MHATAATERAFLDDIRDHPADATPKLVYADWLADGGGSYTPVYRELLSFTYRWAACHGRHPCQSRHHPLVWWCRTGKGSRGTFNLLPALFDQLPARTRGKSMSTPKNLRFAFEALAVALYRLRNLLAC